MDADGVASYITGTFTDTQTTEDGGNLFFSYAPDPNVQVSGWTPFATLIVNDAYDKLSQLDRPSVFRLNIGLAPETYRKLFGNQPTFSRESEVIATRHDFTALDQLMPHPIYAPMSWVCILSPSEETFQDVKPLLEEAYEAAVKRYERQAKRIGKAG